MLARQRLSFISNREFNRPHPASRSSHTARLWSMEPNLWTSIRELQSKVLLWTRSDLLPSRSALSRAVLVPAQWKDKVLDHLLLAVKRISSNSLSKGLMHPSLANSVDLEFIRMANSKSHMLRWSQWAQARVFPTSSSPPKCRNPSKLSENKNQRTVSEQATLQEQLVQKARV